MPKQYSGKQMNSTMNNLSVGSVVGNQQAASILHQTNTFIQAKGAPNGMSTQPLHQLQTMTQMEGVIATSNAIDNINIQGYQTKPKKKDQTNQQDFRIYKALQARNGSLDE